MSVCSVGVIKFVAVTSGGVGDWPQAVRSRARGGGIQVTGCRVGRGRSLGSHLIFIKNVSFSIPSHS